jgi:hypothetical protein
MTFNVATCTLYRCSGRPEYIRPEKVLELAEAGMECRCGLASCVPCSVRKALSMYHNQEVENAGQPYGSRRD